MAENGTTKWIAGLACWCWLRHRDRCVRKLHWKMTDTTIGEASERTERQFLEEKHVESSYHIETALIPLPFASGIGGLFALIMLGITWMQNRYVSRRLMSRKHGC